MLVINVHNDHDTRYGNRQRLYIRNHLEKDYCVDHYPCLWLVSSKGIVTWMSFVVLQPFAFI